jgi:hypothetical protein
MNNSVPEDSRLEIKFSAYEIQCHKLIQWIRIHPAGFCVPFPDRWVNNIYFDTHNYHAFTENLSGASSRTKIRYRWYGESTSPDIGILEVKCKRNYFGWKHRYSISVSPYKSGYSWKNIREKLIEQLPLEGKNLLNANPLPVIINQYYRKYFLSSDGKIRVTVDTKQAVWDQRFKPFPNFEFPSNLPNTLVVEFKFCRNYRGLASEILKGIPLRVSKHSKYINGLRAIHGRL